MLRIIQRKVSARVLASVIACAVAIALVGISAAGKVQPEAVVMLDGIQTAPVARGRITTKVKGHGQLDALKSTRLISRCYWDARIIKLVPEGTLVKKGDIICELDSSGPQEYAVSRRLRLMKIKAELDQSALDRKLVELKNKRRTSVARRSLTDARFAFDEYAKGNEPATRDRLEGQLRVADSLREQARLNFNTAEELYQQGVATKGEVDSTAIKLSEAEQNWLDISGEQSLHEQYTARRELFSLQGALDDAELEFDAVAVRNSLSLTQADFAKLSDSRRFSHYTRYLGYALTSIDACTIRAPHDGRVLYANDWHRRSYGRADIEEGAEVDYRQAIIDLPDYSHFVVKAWVTESEISKLERGQAAWAVVPALANRELWGQVIEIGRFPTVRDRYRSTTPEYSVTIDFDSMLNNLEGLSPRMDAKVEIVVSDVDDVLQVPVESIMQMGDGPSVIVSNGEGLESRAVNLGITNDETIEILSGVEEGEELVLDPPYELVEQVLQDERQREAAMATQP